MEACAGPALLVDSFKIFVEVVGPPLDKIVNRLDLYLQSKTIPPHRKISSWAVFKRGDLACCDALSYMPHKSVYKILAALFKRCLIKADVDDERWKSQLGLRRAFNTMDAIHARRRVIEVIEMDCAQRHDQFDSVSVPGTIWLYT